MAAEVERDVKEATEGGRGSGVVVRKLMRGNFFIYNYNEGDGVELEGQHSGCCCYLKYLLIIALLFFFGFFVGVYAQYTEKIIE